MDGWYARAKLRSFRNWSTNPGERFRGTACARFSVSMKLKLSVLVMAVAIYGCVTCGAMERWSALSQIESGDNDKAVGRLRGVIAAERVGGP